MLDNFKSFWRKLNGRYLPQEIYTADELIQTWMAFYSGEYDREYTFTSLSSYVHKRKRRTLNAGKMACSELAKLVYSEMPGITTDEDILQNLKDTNFFQKLQKHSEYAMAGGGFAMKLVAKNGNLLVDFVPAELFIPVSWENGTITEADFVSKITKDNKNYLKIEQHRFIDSKVVISYAIYKEDGEEYKKLKAIDFDSTLSDVVLDVQSPLFAYVANPEANNFSIYSPVGISLFANAIDTIRSIDIVFDSIAQEVLLGKRRIIVPAQAIRMVLDKDGNPVRYFDPHDEVFQAFNSEDAANQKILDNTVELRIEELKLALQTMLNVYCQQIGFSSGYLSFDGVSMKTATEVISENSKTFKTKQSWENAIGAGVLYILEMMRVIGSDYSLKTSSMEYGIAWNDSIIEDRNAKTAYWNDRYIKGTATLVDVFMNVDGMTEEEANKKAAEMEAKKTTFDVSNIFGNGA